MSKPGASTIEVIQWLNKEKAHYADKKGVPTDKNYTIGLILAELTKQAEIRRLKEEGYDVQGYDTAYNIEKAIRFAALREGVDLKTFQKGLADLLPKPEGFLKRAFSTPFTNRIPDVIFKETKLSNNMVQKPTEMSEIFRHVHSTFELISLEEKPLVEEKSKLDKLLINIDTSKKPPKPPKTP